MEAKVATIVDKKIQKALKRAARPDYKIYNTAVATTGFSYDSGCYYINHAPVIVNGTTISNRIGNEVRLKRLRYQFAFTAGDNTNVIRYIIVRARNAQVPTTASTMSANILSGVTGVAQICAPVDHTQWDVLHDELFQVHYAPVDGSTATSVAIPVCRKGEVDCGNVLLRYSQQTSTNITGKQVIMLFVSDSAIAPNPSVFGYASMEFTDA